MFCSNCLFGEQITMFYFTFLCFGEESYRDHFPGGLKDGLGSSKIIFSGIYWVWVKTCQNPEVPEHPAKESLQKGGSCNPKKGTLGFDPQQNTTKVASPFRRTEGTEPGRTKGSLSLRGPPYSNLVLRDANLFAGGSWGEHVDWFVVGVLVGFWLVSWVWIEDDLTWCWYICRIWSLTLENKGITFGSLNVFKMGKTAHKVWIPFGQVVVHFLILPLFLFQCCFVFFDLSKSFGSNYPFLTYSPIPVLPNR